jgi:hypothetical protein
MPRAWVPVALDLVLRLCRLDSLPLHIGGGISSAYGKRLDVIDNIVRAGAARPSCRGAPVLPLELITGRGRPMDCEVMLWRCGCYNAVPPGCADIGGRPTANRMRSGAPAARARPCVAVDMATVRTRVAVDVDRPSRSQVGSDRAKRQGNCGERQNTMQVPLPAEQTTWPRIAAAELSVSSCCNRAIVCLRVPPRERSMRLKGCSLVLGRK